MSMCTRSSASQICFRTIICHRDNQRGTSNCIFVLHARVEEQVWVSTDGIQSVPFGFGRDVLVIAVFPLPSGVSDQGGVVPSVETSSVVKYCKNRRGRRGRGVMRSPMITQAILLCSSIATRRRTKNTPLNRNYCPNITIS